MQRDAVGITFDDLVFAFFVLKLLVDLIELLFDGTKTTNPLPICFHFFRGRLIVFPVRCGGVIHEVWTQLQRPDLVLPTRLPARLIQLLQLDHVEIRNLAFDDPTPHIAFDDLLIDLVFRDAEVGSEGEPHNRSDWHLHHRASPGLVPSFVSNVSQEIHHADSCTFESYLLPFKAPVLPSAISPLALARHRECDAELLLPACLEHLG